MNLVFGKCNNPLTHTWSAAAARTGCPLNVDSKDFIYLFIFLSLRNKQGEPNKPTWGVGLHPRTGGDDDNTPLRKKPAQNPNRKPPPPPRRK